MVILVWITSGDQLWAIQLNRTNLKSLVIHGNSHLHHCQNQKPRCPPQFELAWTCSQKQFPIQPSSLDGTSLEK